MNAIIYALSDPVTHEVRYVGATWTPLHRRVGRHAASAKAGKTSPVSDWLRTLPNCWPHSTVLQRCTLASELRDAEERWIAAFRDTGSTLLNACAPGDHRSWTA